MTNGLIYLTYNSAQQIEKNWDSLIKGITQPIIIKCIDNGSSDDTVAALERRGAKVTVNPVNVGYTKAINQGLQELVDKVDWVYIINPDVGCQPAWDTLVENLTGIKECGIVGTRLINGLGGVVHSGGKISDPVMVYWSTKHDLPDGYSIIQSDGICTTRFIHRQKDSNAVETVPWVTFAVVALRSDMVRDIGYLDETYFLYCSDSQYCMRAWQAGWEVWYNPMLTFQHEESVSLRSADDEVQRMAVADKRRFALQEELTWLQSLVGSLPRKTLAF